MGLVFIFVCVFYCFVGRGIFVVRRGSEVKGGWFSFYSGGISLVVWVFIEF